MPTGWGRQVRTDFQKLATQNSTLKTYTTPFAALCTVNPGDDGQGNNTAGTTEPSSTGSYARQSITWSNPSVPVSNDVACVAANSNTISWTSTAAFSTGSNVLAYVAIYNTSTLATTTETAFLGRAAITGGGFAVNASGITLSIAAAGLTMNCISA